MTNATDAMTSQYMADVVQAAIECLCANGFQSRTHRLTEVRDRLRASPITINHDGIDRKLIDDPTPAGSASGEVPFAVVGGVEFDSPQALCAAHADLQAEVAQLRESRDAYAHDAAALLQINKAATAALETAEAALAEARRDAERYLWLVENAVIETDAWRHDGRDAASTKQPLDKAIDAALHQRKENGHAG